MEFGKNRWKVLGFEVRNVKHDKSKTAWKLSALIAALVVGIVMAALRRKSKVVRRIKPILRKVKPEVTIGRGRVRVALRTGGSRRRSTRRYRSSTRHNGAHRVSRAVRAAAHAAAR